MYRSSFCFNSTIPLYCSSCTYRNIVPPMSDVLATNTWPLSTGVTQCLLCDQGNRYITCNWLWLDLCHLLQSIEVMAEYICICGVCFFFISIFSYDSHIWWRESLPHSLERAPFENRFSQFWLNLVKWFPKRRSSN